MMLEVKSYCVSSKDRLAENSLEIRKVQKQLIQVASFVRDARFRDQIKIVVIDLISKVDELVNDVKEGLEVINRCCDEFTHQETPYPSTQDPTTSIVIPTPTPEGDQSESDEEVYYDMDDDSPRRTHLPQSRKDVKVSLWSILKQCVGKDLSRIAMPITLNEPLSFLQRISENFQHVNLLEQAAASPDPHTRMLLVCAFSMSAYSSTLRRLYKPFNPLLGETYELTHPSFHFLAEQVSHHPPTSAYFVKSKNFLVQGDITVRNRFTGTAVNVRMIGPLRITLLPLNELYEYRRPRIRISNIIFGTPFPEVEGIVVMRNITSGGYAILEYRRKSWTKGHGIDGVVVDADHNLKYKITGAWDQHVVAYEIDEAKSLAFSLPIHRIQQDDTDNLLLDWDKIVVKAHTRVDLWTAAETDPSEEWFGFTEFAMQLNQPPRCPDAVAQTDARLRPDIRALENGDLEYAADMKSKLEEHQRTRAKHNASAVPRWFVASGDRWTYSGNPEDTPVDIFDISS